LNRPTYGVQFIYSFAAAAGAPLNLPATLQPYKVPTPTATQVTAQALVQSPC